jgi:anti-sigma-K factor RskA
MIETRPSPQVWKRLEKTLGLARPSWFQRVGFRWAIAATAAFVIVIGVQLARQEPEGVQIAQLSGKAATVSAHLSRDGRTLVLQSDRPVVAGPSQSYELWLLTPEGGVLSLAVLGSLDARFEVPERHRANLRGQLAVSVEPAGGSPTGKPTGPVILVGPIKSVLGAALQDELFDEVERRNDSAKFSVLRHGDVMDSLLDHQCRDLTDGRIWTYRDGLIGA